MIGYIVEPGLVATNFSIQLGSKTFEDNPYAAICNRISVSSKEKREFSDFCQSPEEIACFLRELIENSNPQLRYQTSHAAIEEVSQWMKDLSGKDYFEWMKAVVAE